MSHQMFDLTLQKTHLKQRFNNMKSFLIIPKLRLCMLCNHLFYDINPPKVSFNTQKKCLVIRTCN